VALGPVGFEISITVLARASSSLAVNQSFNFQLAIIASRSHLIGYDIATKIFKYVNRWTELSISLSLVYWWRNDNSF
jgi:hypothetical protein